jgi:hypothetical protein
MFTKSCPASNAAHRTRWSQSPRENTRVQQEQWRTHLTVGSVWFQVLTATSMKIAVFYDAAPCRRRKRPSISIRLHGATSQKTASRLQDRERCLLKHSDRLTKGAQTSTASLQWRGHKLYTQRVKPLMLASARQKEVPARELQQRWSELQHLTLCEPRLPCSFSYIKLILGGACKAMEVHVTAILHVDEERGYFWSIHGPSVKWSRTHSKLFAAACHVVWRHVRRHSVHVQSVLVSSSYWTCSVEKEQRGEKMHYEARTIQTAWDGRNM